MNPPKFGIVIPCFNEAGNLLRLISECEQIAESGAFQFVLVNNGSTDSSTQILKEIKNPSIRVLTLDPNRGYGGGILEGLHSLETEFVGWIHADLQTNLKESLTFVANQTFDYFKGIRTGRNPAERFFTAGMGIFCSALFRTPLYEINAQPTVMKRSLFESWVNPPADFSLDLFSLVVAKRAKADIRRSKFYFGDRFVGQSSWNFGFKSRIKMISRTFNYAWSLYRAGTK
jgi:glycosyltransferase involved in cell wall biosynthesis